MTATSRGARRLAAVVAAAVLVLALAQPGPADARLRPPPGPALEGPPPATEVPVEVEASAWVLVEGASGQVLAGHAGDERRPVASTIKVLAALTVLDRAALDDEVEVGDEVVGVGGASVGLTPGDVWTVEELLDALLARSGNDAAEALAAHVAGSTPAFVRLMAEDARRLGLEGVTLTSPSGLDDGNLLSARDLATIARAALAHDALRPLLARAVVELPGLGAVESRNELLFTHPEATGVKTGYTDAAGSSLVASAERGGRELVVVLLDAGEDPARFEAAAGLLDHGFERFAVRTVRGRMTLAVGGGGVHLEAGPAPITTPAGAPPRLVFEVPVRPPSSPTQIPVVVGDVTVGHLTADPVGARRPRVATTVDIGRAAADGVYAALRAATTAGVLR